jgi:antitoxin CcdA
MRMPIRRRAATPNPRSSRRRTNLTIAPEYVAEARELGINLSEACERGLIAEIAEARAAKWLAENREALESSNAWIEANGLPLASKRLF